MELCKKLREKDAHTPIIVLTCKSEESDKALALELGADDYIRKKSETLSNLKKKVGDDCQQQQKSVIANENCYMV